MTPQCQICGRRKPTNKAGMVVVHYFRGSECRGVGQPPYDLSGGALAAAFEHFAATDRAFRDRFIAHTGRRSNAPLDDAFFIAWLLATREHCRLRVRLRNWRSEQARRIAA